MSQNRSMRVRSGAESDPDSDPDPEYGYNGFVGIYVLNSFSVFCVGQEELKCLNLLNFYHHLP